METYSKEEILAMKLPEKLKLTIINLYNEIDYLTPLSLECMRHRAMNEQVKELPRAY